MSRARLVPTRIASATELAAALKDLGFRDVEVHREPSPLQSWRGKPLGRSAEVVVRRSSIGVTSDDVGFARNAHGGFDALISDIHLSRFTKGFFAELEKRCPTLVAGAAGAPIVIDPSASSREPKTPLAVPPAKPPPIPQQREPSVRERDPLRDRDQLTQRDPLSERGPLPQHDPLGERGPKHERVHERSPTSAQRDERRSDVPSAPPSTTLWRQRSTSPAVHPSEPSEADVPESAWAEALADPSIRRGVDASLEAARKSAKASVLGCLVIAALPVVLMLPALASGRGAAVGGVIVILFLWAAGFVAWTLFRAATASRAAVREFQRHFRPGTPERNLALTSLRMHATAIADANEKQILERALRHLHPRLQQIRRLSAHDD